MLWPGLKNRFCNRDTSYRFLEILERPLKALELSGGSEGLGFRPCIISPRFSFEKLPIRHLGASCQHEDHCHLPDVRGCGTSRGGICPDSRKNVVMFYIFNGNIHSQRSTIDFKDWIENVLLQ